MFNKSGIHTTSAINVTQILANVEMQSSVGCIVAKSAGVVDGTKTIVKAGTPVTGSLDALGTAMVAATTSTVGEANVSNAIGIILHDVDVSDGNANATMLLFGFVNTNRIDTTTKAKITTEVKTALPMIKFMAV